MIDTNGAVLDPAGVIDLLSSVPLIAVDQENKPKGKGGEKPGERGDKEQPKPAEQKFAKAKDSTAGEIRQDKDGNYWVKGEDRMWSSYNDPKNNMTSDSGFEGTKWGDSLMDENTKEITNKPSVDQKEKAA
jgi:hypothetical protein